MITFIVGYIDFSNNELILERIQAVDWMEAVEKHSKYPYRYEKGDLIESAKNLSIKYNDGDLKPEESFRQCCFDCDSMMNWIEL